jgi:transcriptional regulator with XRE-family HTH domain
MTSKIASGAMAPVFAVSKHPGMSRKKSSRSPTHARQPTLIRAWREHRGLSQEALAERMEAQGLPMSPGQISRIENGKSNYTQPSLEALARALDTDAAALLKVDPETAEAMWDAFADMTQAEREYAREMVAILRKAQSGAS